MELEKAAAGAILALVVLSVIVGAGCAGLKEHPRGQEDPDSDGDGVPDSEDEFPLRPNWGLNLTYLDNTEMNPGEYKVRISAATDYGVLLIDNTGVAEDTVDLEVVSEPDGWGVSLERASVTLDNESIGFVVLTYTAPSGASGEEAVIIQGTSANALLPTSANITLYLVAEGASGQVTSKGDKVSVDYTVWDTSGAQLDSGTLPATAGEKYVGPLQNLGYITGFYMGLIGMEKPGGILGLTGQGETKQIRVPPQLAYGTDPDAHELGGETLIFELTINSST